MKIDVCKDWKNGVYEVIFWPRKSLYP